MQSHPLCRPVLANTRPVSSTLQHQKGLGSSCSSASALKTPVAQLGLACSSYQVSIHLCSKVHTHAHYCTHYTYQYTQRHQQRHTHQAYGAKIWVCTVGIRPFQRQTSRILQLTVTQKQHHKNQSFASAEEWHRSEITADGFHGAWLHFRRASLMQPGLPTHRPILSRICLATVLHSNSTMALYLTLLDPTHSLYDGST